WTHKQVKIGLTYFELKGKNEQTPTTPSICYCQLKTSGSSPSFDRKEARTPTTAKTCHKVYFCVDAHVYDSQFKSLARVSLFSSRALFWRRCCCCCRLASGSAAAVPRPGTPPERQGPPLRWKENR
ncbi:unnamed protein product, partial [Ectocarpus sp. 4 AP-2014]